MPFILALFTIFLMQASAEGQDSGELSSSSSATQQWGKSREMLFSPRPDEAKVKAMIRELLGEERPAPPSPKEEDSRQGESP